MEIMNIVNEIACLLIFVNTALFYIFIFGRSVPIIDNLPKVENYLLRIGLITISAGGLFNVLSTSYPPNIEIIINVGYACLFTWASIFHYKYFVRKGKR